MKIVEFGPLTNISLQHGHPFSQSLTPRHPSPLEDTQVRGLFNRLAALADVELLIDVFQGQNLENGQQKFKTNNL